MSPVRDRTAARRSHEGSQNGPVRPSFGRWLDRQRGIRDDLVSDFADLAAFDEDFPRGPLDLAHHEWADYQPDWVRRMFEEAVAEFKEDVRKKKPVRGSGERFKWIDLGAYEPQPVEWLCEPILLANTHTLIVAESGSGNTMLALNVALPVVRARRPIVYLDQENGPDVIKERASAIGYADSELSEHFHYLPYPNAGPGELDQLVAEVQAREPVLVIVDPKVNFLGAAELDENSATDTTHWHLSVVQQLRHEIDAAVLEFDHAGWDGKRARGASAKRGHAEAEWFFEVDEAFDRDRTSTATLTRGSKNRRSMLPVELKYRMGGDSHGGFIFAPITDRAAQEAKERQVRADREFKQAVLDIAGANGEGFENGVSRTHLEKELRARGFTFDQKKVKARFDAIVGAADNPLAHSSGSGKNRYYVESQ